VTRPFTPAQKFRILVTYDALVVVDGVFAPIGKVIFGTLSNHKRYALCRKWGAVVRCACGCGVWARLEDIDFDHHQDHVMGGLTAISNGRPLRRNPCHAAKTAKGAAITGKVRRVRRKLSVTRRCGEGLAPAPLKRRPWPTRSIQSRPFPQRQRHEANT
jgi:hypothetical protein